MSRALRLQLALENLKLPSSPNFSPFRGSQDWYGGTPFNTTFSDALKRAAREALAVIISNASLSNATPLHTHPEHNGYPYVTSATRSEAVELTLTAGAGRSSSATWTQFAAMDGVSHHQIPPLPRQLPVFPMPEVDPYVIGDVDPEYRGAPLTYVLGKLHALSPQLTRGIMSVVSDAGGVSSTSIPRDMDLVVQDVNAMLPTHILAVLNEQSGKGYLYPIHALVLAAHCANLPLMPPAPRNPQPRLRSNKSYTITVPVVRLSLPHPESFRILHDYLYTKRCDMLMSSLLPLPPSSLPRLDSCVNGTLRKLSTALASTHSTSALIESCRNIHGLWSNVCKLGIADDALWRSMEVAWGVLIESLDISAGGR